MSSSTPTTVQEKSPQASTSPRTSSEQSAPPNFSHPTTLVTFVIGGKDGSIKEDFFVHKEFACYYSPVLKAALNSNFIEGQSQIYTLHDVEPKIFRLLVQWLYTKAFDGLISQVEAKLPFPRKTKKESAEYNKQLDIAKLWILGERLLMPGLQNTAILAFARCYKKFKSSVPLVLEYIYENTSPGSPLRGICIDIVQFSVANIDSLEFKQAGMLFPKELLFDVCCAVGKLALKRNSPIEIYYVDEGKSS